MVVLRLLQGEQRVSRPVRARTRGGILRVQKKGDEREGAQRVSGAVRVRAREVIFTVPKEAPMTDAPRRQPPISDQYAARASAPFFQSGLTLMPAKADDSSSSALESPPLIIHSKYRMIMLEAADTLTKCPLKDK